MQVVIVPMIHVQNIRTSLLLAFFTIALAAPAIAQEELDPTGWQSKLRFHADSALGPRALVSSVVYAGLLQEADFPREWGQGSLGYSKRLGSTLAYSGLRNALAFGLDTALHQDPRYYPSRNKGFWRRTKHVFRRTILTRTDSGKETVATWRLESGYAATFISNEWYPDRLNTVKLGLAQGTAQIGFDLLGNVASEFWPDIKKLLHRKP